MKRRSLAALCATVVVLLIAGSPALAGESISGGRWAGSALDPGPTAVDVGSYNLSGTFRRDINRSVQVTLSASPAGTGACGIEPTVLPPGTTPRGFAANVPIPCNGIYTLAATAVTTDNNAVFPEETATLDRQVAVSAPAPQVTGVEASAQGRTITVIWNDMLPEAPDLAGYVVERSINGSAFEEVAATNPDELFYDDSDLPSSKGTATYRVLAVRPSPDGDKVSVASEEAATPFVAAPRTGGSGGDGGSDGGSGTDGSGSDGGSGGSDGGGGGSDGSGAGGSSKPRVSAPRVFSGTFLPPLLRPVSQTVTTPTTLDTGYDESLPYARRSGGGDDEPALASESTSSILTDGKPGRGMVIPVATSLVLAIWAIHLRMLARAARPVASP
ncbi:MAG: hypothetical protein ACOYXM_06590 [Actinomycetota bacterium]